MLLYTFIHHNNNVHSNFLNEFLTIPHNSFYAIGRGVIIHADEDDCGQGGQPDSLTTGHAGKRIACAVIGYASPQHVNK